MRPARAAPPPRAPPASAAAPVAATKGAPPASAAGRSPARSNFANWDAYIDLTTVPGRTGSSTPTTTSTTCRRRRSTSSPPSTASRSTTPTPRSTDNESFMERSDRSSRPASDRLGPDRPDRLDGRQAGRGRLGREDPAPTRRPPWRTSATSSRACRGTPTFELPLPVAVGRDRRRLQRQVDGTRPDEGRRPVRSKILRARSPSSRIRDTFPLIHMMLQAQGKASTNAPESMTSPTPRSSTTT